MAKPNPRPLKWLKDMAWKQVLVLDEDFDNIPNQYEPTAENLQKHRVIQPTS